jgi:hypothetical protein
MDNPQHKPKDTYRTTDYWEVWDTQVKKLKDYLSIMPINEISFEIVKDHIKQENT